MIGFVGVVAGACLAPTAEFLRDVLAIAHVPDKFALVSEAAIAFDKLINRVSEAAVGMVALFARQD